MTFNERYQKWKAGELVYSAGKILPQYDGGKDEDPTNTLPEVTITPDPLDAELIRKGLLMNMSAGLRRDIANVNQAYGRGDVNANQQYRNMLDLYEMSGAPNVRKLKSFRFDKNLFSSDGKQHSRSFYVIKNIGHKLGLNKDYSTQFTNDYRRSYYNRNNNTMYLASPYFYYDELAHAYQYSHPETLVALRYKSVNGLDDTGHFVDEGRSHKDLYNTLGSIESIAHKQIVPRFEMWHRGAHNGALSKGDRVKNQLEHFSQYPEHDPQYDAYATNSRKSWDYDKEHPEVQYDKGKDASEKKKSYSLGDITSNEHWLDELVVTKPSVTKQKQLPSDSPYTLGNMINTQMQNNLRNYLLNISGINDILNPFSYNTNYTPFKLSQPEYDKGKDDEFSISQMSKEQLANAQSMYDYFVSNGISPIDAAGIMGNVMGESSFNAKADNGTHFGEFQMSKDMLKAVKRAYGSFNTENARRFVLDMLNGDSSKIGKQWTSYGSKYKKGSYKTVKDSAAAWNSVFERSGKLPGARLRYADAFYNHFAVQPALQKRMRALDQNTAPQDAVKVVNQQMAPVVPSIPSNVPESLWRYGGTPAYNPTISETVEQNQRLLNLLDLSNYEVPQFLFLNSYGNNTKLQQPWTPR